MSMNTMYVFLYFLAIVGFLLLSTVRLYSTVYVYKLNITFIIMIHYV